MRQIEELGFKSFMILKLSSSHCSTDKYACSPRKWPGSM